MKKTVTLMTTTVLIVSTMFVALPVETAQASSIWPGLGTGMKFAVRAPTVEDVAPGAFSKINPPNGATNQGSAAALNWGFSNGATSYEYCFDDTGSCNSWSNIGSFPYILVGGLHQNTTYYWDVRAANDFGTTYSDGSSAVWSFTTGGPPTAFSKSGPANGSTNQHRNLTLSWTASTGGLAMEYQYCYSSTNPCTYADETYTYDTSIQLGTLEPNKTYYWNVRAVDDFGSTDSDGSTTDWSFTTGTDWPGAFSKIGPADGAANQPSNLTLSWGASDGTTQYAVCIDETNDGACNTYWINAYTATSIDPYLFGLLSPNTTYYWQVEATNSFGTTYADGDNFHSFTMAPNPGNFSMSGPANGATNQPADVTLSWTASGGAISYQYCYGITSTPCSSWIDTGTTRSASLNGLSPNTTYYWLVRAFSFGYTFPGGSHNSGTMWSFTTGIPTPVFNANPAAWDYGVVKVGTTSAGKVFTIKNAGTANLTFTGTPSLAGSGSGQFHITATTCTNANLLPNATCTITVTFKATTAGAKTASISIPDNAAGRPHKIMLSGKGGTEQSLNGGFNAYPNSTAKVPTNWAPIHFASTDGKDMLTKQEGAASVWIRNTSAIAKTLTQTRNVSGAKGSTFLLSLWGKGQGIPTTAGVVQAQVLLYNGALLVQAKSITFPNGSYGFTRKALAFTAPGSYNRIVIKLLYSKRSGSVWFDGVSLLRSP